MATYYVKSGVATPWAATTAYTTQRVVPTLAYGTGAAKGRIYECTTAGTSGAAQPTWNTTVGGTTADGTVTWTTRDITSWANASPYLHYAVNYRNNASPQGGDTIYVSQAHAESVAQTDNFNSTGSTTIVNILCANDSATPPTTLATGATVTITSNQTINMRGYIYSYGVSYTIGSGQAGTISFSFLDFGAGLLIIDSCTVSNASSGSFLGFQMGAVNSNQQEILFNDVKVSFGSTSQAIIIQNRFTWKNTPTAIQGFLPSPLFKFAGSNITVLNGVDISAVTGSIITPDAYSNSLFIQNCKVNANILTTFSTTPPSQPGYTKSYLHNCDSGATTYKLYEIDYYGTTRTETTLVKTGGASDGTTTNSWKMISASGTTFYSGLESPIIGQWQNTTGSVKTATIEILHDSATALTNADIYAEVEYFSTTNPGTSFANNRAADILVTPANHATSSVTWTTTGMANPNKQYLQVSFTPGMVGPIRVRVYLLKASYTVYIDPLVTIA